MLGWLYVSLPCLAIVFKIGELKLGHHNGFQRILSQIFIYWDVDPSGLSERRLWSKRTIPWQEVMRVSGWMDRPSLAVHYARSAPLSDRGTVVATPEDREQFLADLYRYAPQATFDV